MSNRHSYRSPATGRWMRVSTELARDERSDRFPQTDSIEVGSPSDVQDSPYELVSGDRNVVQRPVAPYVRDDLGVTGSPLRARRPEMVSAEDAAHTIYGRQGAVLRSAARDSGPMDPSYSLVSPMESHGTPLQDVKEARDGRAR
jgi:hypothetical protein